MKQGIHSQSENYLCLTLEDIKLTFLFLSSKVQFPTIINWIT